jgi:hypothetical protein
MAIDLNTLPEEEGEEVPDLNKIPDEHEEDLDPLEDVVVAVQVGGAELFGLHPDENDEDEEINQGKHIGLSPSLVSSHLRPLPLVFPSPLLKLQCCLCYPLKITNKYQRI